jgi:hypothetical protein
MIILDDLSTVLDRTEQHMRNEGYRGYDPYDGLMSPLFGLPVLRSAKLPRWGFQQILKRLPFQLRPSLGIAKGYNPATLGIAIQGLVYREQADRSSTDDRRKEVERLVHELDRLQSPGFSGACWGYDFDWESRYARIPAFHPTVVATGFVTNALYLAWKHYGLEEARELCISAGSFVTRDLHKTRFDEGFCWSYSPTDRQVVLNATMKGARLLAQAVSMGANSSLLVDASATIKYVVSRQESDGSWPYSIGDSRSWVDHFHTCYNLDCIHEYQSLTGDDTFRKSLSSGLDYYCSNFFTEEGAPKYYDRHLYPIDATCCAQALLTLLRFGELSQAEKTGGWILEQMVLPQGRFKYQIHRHYANQLPYMRWSTGWLFAGLARLEAALRRGS